jgi:hypothetical protein
MAPAVDCARTRAHAEWRTLVTRILNCAPDLHVAGSRATRQFVHVSQIWMPARLIFTRISACYLLMSSTGFPAHPLRPRGLAANCYFKLSFGHRFSCREVLLERCMPKLIYGTLLSKNSELVRILEKCHKGPRKLTLSR